MLRPKTTLKVDMIQGGQQLANDDPDALVRLPLVPQIVARLREEIVAGSWAPGQKMPEAELSRRFSVSRTPLRQAFKALESEGLLELLPNRGACVTAPTVEGLDDKLALIAVMEGLSIECACASAPDAALDHIVSLHQEMMESYDAQDAKSYYRLNASIHRAIVKAGDNRILIGIHETLMNHVERARNLANISHRLDEGSRRDHEKIIAALQARKGKVARRLMEKHCMDVRKAVNTWVR
ncbi:MAG: GntR family transcriptional regulator [Pseudomonadota bacterium]